MHYEGVIAQQEGAIGEFKEQIGIYQQQIQSLNLDLEECLNQKGKLTKELNQAATYVIEMEEKVYKSNKISLNLLAKLKDAEMELGKWPKLFT